MTNANIDTQKPKSDLFQQLEKCRKHASFTKVELVLTMSSGTTHTTTQYVNELAQEPTLLHGLLEQGYLHVDEQTIVHATHIESVVHTYTDDKGFIVSDGMNWLNDIGYTSEAVILSEKRYQETQRYIDNHIEYEPDD